MKRCPKCKTEKPETEFYKDQTRKDRLQAYCKACCSAIASAFQAKLSPEQKLELYKGRNEWRKKNPGKMKRYQRRHRLKKYGLTEAGFEAILFLQDRRCAICARMLSEAKQTEIDHCHTTGKVRGILCNLCNTALGIFRDSEVVLLSAIEYLRKTKITNNKK